MTNTNDWYLRFSFDQLSPQVVAECMMDLLKYILVKGLDGGQFDDPANTFLSYLKSIAFKEETTYQYIINGLAKLVQQFEGQEAHFRLKFNLLHIIREYYLQKIEYESLNEAVQEESRYIN